MCKIRIVILFFFFLSYHFVFSQQLLINELVSSNRDELFDEDGDSPDWVEILNVSENSINLGEYYLSDKINEPLKWQFPDIELNPGQFQLIFASGKDKKRSTLFWHNLVDKGDEWKYLVPENELPENWHSTDFDDSPWLEGHSGFGYGDSDDSTQIPSGSLSVFLRKKIIVEQLENISDAILHIDFDDAFVAYLNGIEIARYGIGNQGVPVPFNEKANGNHEAKIYKGELPDEFKINNFEELLVVGENVLAVQVHNISSNSSDFSAIPFLSLGFSSKPSFNLHNSMWLNFSKEIPHANFKLSSKGETVYLAKQNGIIIDSLHFEAIPIGYSFGRSEQNKAITGFLPFQTPGEPNQSETITEWVESRVVFSELKTFLDSETEVELTGAGIGEQIRFTLNDKTPTIENSTLYSNPVKISENTIIRARVFKNGALPGRIASKCYLFEEPPTLPVVSVITDSVHLWDNETGIYILGDEYEEERPHYGANYWEEWEKPANIEMINTEGQQLFSSACGIKIFGGWSRMRDQKSLSVFFRNGYDKPAIENIQLFPSKPIQKFQSFVLRNGGNDAGFGKIRDGMMTSLVRNLDTDISAYQPTIMFLNGEYWGIINLREKINEDFIESNSGVDADELDLLERNGRVLEGSNESYWDLIGFLEANDISNNENYSFVESQIDISNYIDYQLSQIYFDNRDWPGNNLKYWKPQADDGKWRWIIFDTDFGFSIYDATAYERNTLDFALEPYGPDWPNPPWSTFIFRKLLENEGFKHRFINRYADILNTTFQPDSVVRHVDSLASNIRPEIQKNWEKWNSPNPGWWEENVERMRNFGVNRINYVRNHIKQEFGLPNHVPQLRGKVEEGSP